MQTKLYHVEQLNEEALAGIEEAGAILREGGLVAFPTETVYGLGADALNAEAVASIYKAKGRPSDNPIIVHIADKKQLYDLAREVKPEVLAMADAFWPGPLTMILPKKDVVPMVTTGGLDTVGIRMPEEPAALELIRRSGCPVAAPSGNLSGRPSPTRGQHVVQDMFGRIDVILWGNECRIGIESTVVDMTEEKAMILRPGLLTPEAMEPVLGYKPEFDPAILPENFRGEKEKELVPRAPGMKYRHYAPKAYMEIFAGSRSKVEETIAARRQEEEASGKSVGVILFGEDAFEQAARDLFADLREMDDRGVDIILAGAMSSSDSRGFALMNRMLKSAGYNVIRV